MTQQTIITTPHNSGLGDPAFTAFEKANANFTELYTPINRTAAEITAGVTPTNLGYRVGDVRRYGAVGDAVTDDWTAFNNALISNQRVYVPPTAAGYRLSAGITVVPGVTLLSDCFLPGNPVVGTKLVFDLSVATCVTVGGAGASNGTPGLVGLSVTRAAGAIPAGSIGILVQDCYNVTLRDLYSTRHARCWRFFSSSAVLGISANASNLHSSVATDVHWEFDGWPEFRCQGGRSGQSGAGDVVNNGYVRFQGGFGTGGSGPNTIAFIGHQFNQGGNAAGSWLIFNHPVNPGGNALEFRFESCHIEGVSAGITSDASTALINRLQIIGGTFNAPGAPFFSLNAATQPANWEIADNQILCSTFTLAATPQLTAVYIGGNMISGPGSITGAANSVATLAGNSWSNGLTLAGGAWGALVLDGDNFVGGSLTLTATGKMSIHLPSQYFTWTPGVSFGGSGGTFNGTYSRQSGAYQILNNEIVAQYSIILTSKGSTTGAAQITGLPFLSNSGNFAAGVVHIPLAQNLTGLTGALKSWIGAAVNFASLGQTGAAGDSGITDTSFTATTSLSGVLNYML